jgi:hypothetical protein
MIIPSWRVPADNALLKIQDLTARLGLPSMIN